jgi:hypothetical protein
MKRAKRILFEIDSMKKVVSWLTGTAKVDCLNTIAHKFFYAGYNSINQQMDSSYKYCMLALSEAKRIGYKKGMGYSYSRFISIDNGRFNASHYAKKPDSSFLADAKKNIELTIKFGEELKDNTLLGIANLKLAWLAAVYNNSPQYIEYLKKTIYYIERTEKVPQGGYKDQEYADCNGCDGNEYWLAIVYFDLSEAYFSINDIEATRAALKKSVFYYNKGGDAESELLPAMRLAGSYLISGDFEAAFEYSQRILKISDQLTKQPIRYEWAIVQSLVLLSELYETAGDYETALYYIRKARSSFSTDPFLVSVCSAQIGDIFCLMGNSDSAIYYLKPFANNIPEGFIDGMLTNGTVNLCKFYNSLDQADKSLPLITAIMKKATNKAPGFGDGLLVSANTYFGVKDYLKALNDTREAVTQFKKLSRKAKVMDSYELLSKIFHQLGNNDSAYYYLKQYTILKDSILNRQFLWRLNSYKKQADDERKTGQIKLLQKDNLIKAQQLQQQVLLQEQSEAQVLLLDKDNKIKDQQLQIKEQELKGQVLLKDQKQSQVLLLDKENNLKSQRLKQQAFVRNALIAGLLLFLLLAVFVIRNLLLKRKNERLRLEKDLEVHRLQSDQRQSELQRRTIELEMQALRAQMNPHFIFNCLSSINRFIFKNDNKVASDYLTRFSRLIRMVLMHSSKKLIRLEDELEMLRLYFDLERLRFKDAFDYSITTTNIVDAGAIFIPPLLLQPFCENAVWHGLMHKGSKGHLNVTISEVISEQERVLHCVIEDDGIGRQKAAEMKSKSAENEKSMGLKITTERLALLNKENNFSTFYKIEDIVDGNKEVTGTKVQLKIRYKETVEEYA